MGGDHNWDGITPEQVASDVLKHLKAIAEERLEHKVTRAVITVPAYFNDNQRKATMRAGELAGLTVERIVSEPTAAALAYGLNRLEGAARVAVYDWGGGTFDVSILQLKDGVFEVLGTSGDTRLGGDDIDLALAHYLQEKADDDSSIELFLPTAEETKKKLSDVNSVTVRMPFYDGIRSLECDVTRVDLEKMLSPLLQKTEVCCQRALADVGIKDPAELDSVILVGATTRIPAVRERVAKIFRQEPDISQHPDEAIALGAAVQAGILSGAMKNVVLLDVTPLSLGIETYGGLMNVLIPRNSTIPCKAGEMFTNASGAQQKMKIRVLQGEREMARDNWELGCFELDFNSSKKNEVRVGVQFSLDENGVLEVLARDTATGKDTVIVIESSAVDVSDDEVGKMVEESVDFAFKDMNERVFTEAKLKADELLPAVDMGIEQLGDDLPTDEKAEILAAAEAVKAALETQDHVHLKAAVQVLDKTTEAMAAALVEKALGSMEF